MAIFWKSFVLLFLFLQGSHSLMENILEKCSKIFAEDKAENASKYCSECLDVIYKSGITNDPTFRKNIDIGRLNVSFSLICSHLDTFRNQSDFCYTDFKDCALSKFPILQDCYDVIPCLTEKTTTCTADFVDLASKVLLMSRTYGCVFSSQHFKLAPFYGPEQHCYPKTKVSSGLSATKLAENYKYFCSKFNKHNVSECIIDTKLAVGSSPVVDAAYITNAKTFFRERSKMCDDLQTNMDKSCASIDVYPCQKSLFDNHSPSKPFDDLLKTYARCVYDKYKPCSPALAQIIKYNLDEIKTNHATPSGYGLILSPIIILSVYFEITSYM